MTSNVQFEAPKGKLALIVGIPAEDNVIKKWKVDIENKNMSMIPYNPDLEGKFVFVPEVEIEKKGDSKKEAKSICNTEDCKKKENKYDLENICILGGCKYDNISEKLKGFKFDYIFLYEEIYRKFHIVEELKKLLKKEGMITLEFTESYKMNVDNEESYIERLRSVDGFKKRPEDAEVRAFEKILNLAKEGPLDKFVEGIIKVYFYYFNESVFHNKILINFSKIDFKKGENFRKKVDGIYQTFIENMVNKNIEKLKIIFPSPEYNIVSSSQEEEDRTYRYYDITSNNYTVDDNYVKEYFSPNFTRRSSDYMHKDKNKNKDIVYNNIGNFDVFSLLKYKVEDENAKSFFIFEPMNTALSYGKFLKNVGIFPSSSEIKDNSLFFYPLAKDLFSMAGGINDDRNYMVFITKEHPNRIDKIRDFLHSEGIYHIPVLSTYNTEGDKNVEVDYGEYLKTFLQLNKEIINKFDIINFVRYKREADEKEPFKDNEMIREFFPGKINSYFVKIDKFIETLGLSQEEIEENKKTRRANRDIRIKN